MGEKGGHIVCAAGISTYKQHRNTRSGYCIHMWCIRDDRSNKHPVSHGRFRLDLETASVDVSSGLRTTASAFTWITEVPITCLSGGASHYQTDMLSKKVKREGKIGISNCLLFCLHIEPVYKNQLVSSCCMDVHWEYLQMLSYNHLWREV